MSLRYRVANIEEVEEALRGFYDKKTENGGDVYILQVEGAVDRTRLDEFRQNNIGLRRQLEELQAKWGEVDADPETVKALLQKRSDLEDEKLLKKGQVEELVGKRTEQLKADYDKRLTSLSEERNGLLARVSEIEINQAVVGYATKRGLRSTAIPDITSRARTIFRLVDGKPTAFEADGKTPLYGKDAGPLTIEEWVEQRTADAPHLFESSSGSGAAGDGSSGSGSRKVLKNPWKGRRGDPASGWNLTEQGRIIKEDPTLAARLKAEAGVK